MLSQEFQFKRDYAAFIAAFSAAFPTVPSPAHDWVFHWLAKYSIQNIEDAIRILAAHPLKSHFTTTSTGKALSSILRTEALNRARAASAPKFGAVRP